MHMRIFPYKMKKQTWRKTADAFDKMPLWPFINYTFTPLSIAIL